ncbi:kinetochore-associated protein KNL-2 homolog isoform X2 [Cynara cardunculus var. scolymus]|uniref:kinetochore-associated protein KNL-2 homolog isoform X2 n=1 Tax=Cynara cardunculus var. scolymus TaxID=59895 RepID=UPI000D62FF2A|nr:kinetochore-associated protein KNL-2 homolog isoform X2 [Cynara cardunculus var. scolymus]
MALDYTLKFSDAAKSSPPCRSHFQKSVHLRDWWLTKPKPDDDRKTLGVAGLTCISQQNRAERCFSSAPILKVYDFFELETVDGLCVILQGYINKNRTLGNGFRSEVFDHFLIGFPPYWEEFCTRWPKRVSAAQGMSRVNKDGEDSIEGHDDFHDSSQGKLLNRDSHTVDMGVEDCEETILSNKASNFMNASSLEIPHEHIIKAGHEVLCDRSSLTLEFDDDPSLKMSSGNNDIHCMKHDDVRDYPSSKNFKIDAEDSYTVLKCLWVSSRRVTRSMTKMDNSKNRSTHGSVLDDIINLDQSTDFDPGNLGSSDIPRKDINNSLSNNKAVNVVDCDGTNFLHHGASSSIKTAAEKLELLNLRSYQKGNSSSGCGVKCESRKNISTSEGNLDEQNLKKISSNLSFIYENGSNEASTCSSDMVSRIKSKRKQNVQYVGDVTEDLRIKLASQVGTSNLRKNIDADVISESQIATRSDLEAKHFKAKRSNPLDPLSTTSMDVGCLVNCSTENFNFASSNIDLDDNIVISRTNMKACRNKKKDAAREVTGMIDVSDNRGAFKAGAAKQGIVFKEASMTRSKSGRQCITSPKSAKSTSRLDLKHPTRTSAGKGFKDRYGSANILSPESFSGKKSRSGRVLLPALEFWRNQTVVYDADRQVTGVLEGTYITQSSRDISEDNKEFNKKPRKTCKP